MNALEEIRAAFDRRGGDTYGEGVSQLEHALQCAACAERDGASPALITATLLHDIGHLIHDLPQDIADQGIDTQHESLGSAWLSQHFGPDVTEPVRLHVAAKRYLATTKQRTMQDQINALDQQLAATRDDYTKQQLQETRQALVERQRNGRDLETYIGRILAQRQRAAGQRLDMLREQRPVAALALGQGAAAWWHYFGSSTHSVFTVLVVVFL